tara:strand:- start:19 stop:237 length:219 start_codon:yes stop_codon:yes gene_type:complete
VQDKYYVKSGDLRFVVLANNSFDASCKALKSLQKSKKDADLELMFNVNRRGFVSPPEESYDTMLIAEALGAE